MTTSEEATVHRVTEALQAYLEAGDPFDAQDALNRAIFTLRGELTKIEFIIAV